MSTLPAPLIHALQNGNCVLFVGAGVGGHFQDENGNPAPTGKQLCAELIKEFGVPTAEENLSKIAEYVELKNGGPKLDAFVKKRFSKLKPDDIFSWISKN